MPAARLRVSQEHRGVLAVPPLGEAGGLLQLNQARFQQSKTRLLGRTLAELRELAQCEAHAAAAAHLYSIGIPVRQCPNAGCVLTGHQPELFHPGVWVKNFALSGLARRHGLTPLHVLIDNDAVKSASIRVPDTRAEPLRQVAVPFDSWSGPMPYEDCPVHDEAIFARFPEAVHERLERAGYAPLLPKLWKHAQALAPQTPLLGQRLAGARRRLEADWGCQNLEVPLSRLCQTEAFAWFACHLLSELPRFRQVHNECLLAFRRERRIRSRNHPVPELAADGEWLEAPLWGWRVGEWERRRLFVHFQATTFSLSIGDILIAELPRSNPAALVAAYRRIESNGIKLRTRALTTTLFLRLFLADLFVHGIGGAIYDELTDRIIQSFYGMEAPVFLTLSATLHLPLPFSQRAREQLREVRHLIRDLEWNPQRHLEVADGVSETLTRTKQRLANIAPSKPAQKVARFHAIRQITDRLRPYVAKQRDTAQSMVAVLEKRLETERVVGDREYAFCLYPEAELREFVAQFSG